MENIREKFEDADGFGPRKCLFSEAEQAENEKDCCSINNIKRYLLDNCRARLGGDECLTESGMISRCRLAALEVKPPRFNPAIGSKSNWPTAPKEVDPAMGTL